MEISSIVVFILALLYVVAGFDDEADFSDPTVRTKLTARASLRERETDCLV